MKRVESFGLFLEDGGFLNIKQISDFHKGSTFEFGELGEWYPVGTSVIVRVKEIRKLTNGKEQIFYEFLGPEFIQAEYKITQQTSSNIQKELSS